MRVGKWPRRGIGTDHWGLEGGLVVVGEGKGMVVGMEDLRGRGGCGGGDRGGRGR